ncbi:MAG: RNA-binding domain-containing protein [Candidatus Electrothrix sp. GW3-4]|uniref:RNA-binding domain-containing protein n=1 Tax=Candidatus Electrothrix sp. GW3-4 TaxID=3126740 RepID=UPI0030D2E80C
MNIENLLKTGESQTIEFKKSFGRETIETLVAFANAQGGTVLIGVADDGTPCGVSVGKETLNEWLGQIKSATSPSIIPDIELVTLHDQPIVRIHINEYPVKPVNTKGRYFKRIATSNHQLSLSEITDLYLQSLQISWDAHEAPGASLDALSPDKIEKFIAQVNQSGRFMLDPSPLLALEKLKLISQGKPTWAAMLLFADEPLRHHIHIGRFKTSSIIIDDRQITDTLFKAVEQAMKYIIANIRVAFAFDGSLQRKERFSYPLAALREVLLNTVVHRDYTNPSDIQIKVFDNSITFFSPGKLYGDLTLAELETDSYSSHLRNKLIAEAFYLTKNIEKYGSGFVRIRKELAEYPDLRFRIEEVGSGLLVSFELTEDAPPITPRSPPDHPPITELEQKILELLQKNPKASSRELADLLSMRSDTIKEYFGRLKAKGVLRREGSARSGQWIVLQNVEKR